MEEKKQLLICWYCSHGNNKFKKKLINKQIPNKYKAKKYMLRKMIM